jgi:hypothetical protein
MKQDINVLEANDGRQKGKLSASLTLTCIRSLSVHDQCAVSIQPLYEDLKAPQPTLTSRLFGLLRPTRVTAIDRRNRLHHIKKLRVRHQSLVHRLAERSLHES